jgi:hypothetical protein
VQGLVTIRRTARATTPSSSAAGADFGKAIVINSADRAIVVGSSRSDLDSNAYLAAWRFLP